MKWWLWYDMICWWWWWSEVVNERWEKGAHHHIQHYLRTHGYRIACMLPLSDINFYSKQFSNIKYNYASKHNIRRLSGLGVYDRTNCHDKPE